MQRISCGLLALSFLLPLGCKNETTMPAPAPDRSTAARPAARTWPADAPSAGQACTRHADCAVIRWDGPWPPDPCCDARVPFTPVHVNYLRWFGEYRAKSCQGVTCPPAPFPGAEPTCCVVIGRCVKGACVNACDDPTAKVPNVSSLDPQCHMHGMPEVEEAPQ